MNKEQYYKIPNIIACNPNLSGNAKILYSIILSYSNMSIKGNTYIHYKDIQKKIGIKSERQIYNLIKELINENYIYRETKKHITWLTPLVLNPLGITKGICNEKDIPKKDVEMKKTLDDFINKIK